MIQFTTGQANLLVALGAMPQKWVSSCKRQLVNVLSAWVSQIDVTRLSDTISQEYVEGRTKEGFVTPVLVCAMLGTAENGSRGLTISIPVENSDGKFDFVDNVLIRLIRDGEVFVCTIVCPLHEQWQTIDAIAHVMKRRERRRLIYDYDKSICWKTMSACAACMVLGWNGALGEMIDRSQESEW